MYYRSPRPRIVTAPARLLWYASGARRDSGVAAVSPAHGLKRSSPRRPAELHQRFRHLGVWQQDQVAAVAKDGTALALRFADTEIFPHQVTLRRLRGLASEYGQSLSLNQPRRSHRSSSPPSTRKVFRA